MASTSVTQPALGYQINVGGIGFLIDNNSDTPYRRQSSPYKKEQSDNSGDSGEQTFSNWWYRSQSSFHGGGGIIYYDPADEKTKFRYDTSMGLNLSRPGEVSFLNRVLQGHEITGTNITKLQSIMSGTTPAVLSLDGFDVDKIYTSGTTIGTSYDHFLDYNGLTSEPVLDITNDGLYAYYVVNQSSPVKWHIFRKPLTGTAATGATIPALTGDIVQVTTSSGTEVATNARLGWVKERLIACINNKIIQLDINPTTGVGTQTPIYTHPSVTVKFTDVVESGSNVYISGYNGINSFILRLPFDTALNSGVGAFSGAVVVAQMPRGETINCLGYYMGYLAIGTSKGIRVAQVADTGDIAFGPNILAHRDKYFVTPVYGIAFNDSFIFAATTNFVYEETGTSTVTALTKRFIPGLVRIDLSNQIDTLNFAYYQDLSFGNYLNTGPTYSYAAGVAFIGNTDKICFAAKQPFGAGVTGYHSIESSTKETLGHIFTGKIRFNTFENKMFKSLKINSRFKTVTADVDIYNMVDTSNTSVKTYSLGAKNNFDILTAETEKNFPTPIINDEAKFFIRISENTSLTYDGVLFGGYQLKAMPYGVKRQRLVQYPLLNFDFETDALNRRGGYDGKARAVLAALEALEDLGETITVTDSRNAETFTAMIEEVSFVNTAPPDKRYGGFGGKLTVTVRKI